MIEYEGSRRVAVVQVLLIAALSAVLLLMYACSPTGPNDAVEDGISTEIEIEDLMQSFPDDIHDVDEAESHEAYMAIKDCGFEAIEPLILYIREYHDRGDFPDSGYFLKSQWFIRLLGQLEADFSTDEYFPDDSDITSIFDFIFDEIYNPTSFYTYAQVYQADEILAWALDCDRVDISDYTKLAAVDDHSLPILASSSALLHEAQENADAILDVYIVDYITPLLRSDLYLTRRNLLNACYLLKGRANPAWMNVSMVMQDDAHENLRAKAATVLGEIKEEEALAGLGQAAILDDSESVRISALSSIGKYGEGVLNGNDIVITLDGILRNGNESSRVRATAAEAIGASRDLRFASGLGEIAADTDNEPLIRWRCIEALGEMGTDLVDHQVIDCFAQILVPDTEEVTLYKAVEASGLILDPRLINPLGELLGLEEELVVPKWCLAEALGKIGTYYELDGWWCYVGIINGYLGEALLSIPAPELKEISSFYMKEMHDYSGKDALEIAIWQYREDEYTQTRVNCADGLGLIGSEESLNILYIVYLTDPQEIVSNHAWAAMVMIEDGF